MTETTKPLVDGREMTLEQWEIAARKMLFLRLTNKKRLDRYLRSVFGVYLASVPVDEGNSSPLDFVWDIYSTAIGISKNPCYNFMAMAARGSQKCAHFESKILVKNKGIIPIKDLQVGDQVFSFPSWGKVNSITSNGDREIWKLKTHNGYEFKGTKNHRIATYDNGVIFKELSELKNNDYVIIGGHESKIDYTSDDFEIGYMLGVIYGDGNVSLLDQNIASITVGNKGTAKKFIDILNKHFNYQVNLRKRGNAYLASICRHSFLKRLREFGIIQSLSIHKKFPEIVWNSSYDLKSGFISGLFDTDGHISWKRGKGARCLIRFGFGGYDITRDLHSLLVFLGIKSFYSEAKTNYKSSMSYNISIRGEQVLKLLKFIKTYHTKRSIISDIALATDENNLSSDTFPKDKIYKHLKGIQRFYHDNFRYSDTKYIGRKGIRFCFKKITRLKIKKILERYECCKNSVDYQLLTKLVNSHFYLDKVKSVLNTNKIEEVFDISVPEHENFVADGIVVHNSLAGATIEGLMLIQDKIRDWFHCAAIMDQSERTYQYVQKFFNQPWMSSALDGEPKMKETKTIHGTRLQIGTGTIKSVSGFHGCIAGHAKIRLKNKICTIEEFYHDKNKSEFIESFQGWKKFSGIAYRGFQECIKVVLENDFEIDCTPNHEFLYFDPYNSFFVKKMICEFDEGDIIFVNTSWANDSNKQYWSSFFSRYSVFPVKIKSIKLSKSYPTYDIQVEDGKNYWCPNGIIVSNSVVMDEYDLMDKIVTKMAKGMLSAQQGQRPFMIYLSSRYFATGNVEDMVSLSVESDKDQFRMHKWGILEMTERCPEEWSGGEEKTVQAWVNEEELQAISDEEFKKLDDKNAADFAPYQAVPNCLSCGIFSFCKGNLKKQQTRDENPFLEPISETIAKFKDNDTETFKSQRLNRKGSTKDLVYPSWNETLHVKSYAEMYEIYMGIACPETDPSLEYMVNLFLKAEDCFFYYSADCGFTEAAAGLWVVDGMDRIFLLDELTEHGLSDAEFALKIWQTWGHIPFSDGFPDQIPSFMKELKTATPLSELDPKRRKGSLPVNTKVDKSAGSVDAGLQTVRKIIRIPGTLNKTHIWVSAKCTQFRWEIANYRRKMDKKTDTATDVVIKKDDHHPDHARYFLHTVFGKKKGSLISADVEKTKTAKAEIEAIDIKKTSFNLEQPLRAPTAGELAGAIGVVGFRDNSKKSKENSKEKRRSKLTFSI